MPVTSSQTPTMNAILTHHAQLETAVAAAAVSVGDAAERLVDVAPHRDAFVLLMLQEVLPHASAEERTLYAVGADLPETAVLVRAMVAEHRRLEGLVAELARAGTSVSMAGQATAIRVLFEAHLAKENDQLLPALVDAEVNLARLLDGMHEILGAPAAGVVSDAVSDEPGGCGCGGCSCGGDEAQFSADVTVGAERI